MKLLTILFSIVLSFQVFAAPVAPKAVEATVEDEITLEDIQAELMNELDTLVVEEDDEIFLDQEIEKQAEVKKTAEAPATKTATKK